MFQKFQIRPIAFIFLAIGTLLLLISYFRETSFFLDELNLARNLAEKSFSDLFFPFDYEQYAPPLFSILVKGDAEIFGYTEKGLRLIPLIAAISSFLLFYKLLQSFFKKELLLYPLALFVFNLYVYIHGIELKQYSLDVLITISWLILAINTKRISKHNIFKFSLLGMFSVWFSMPSVFVMTGVGLYFLYNEWTYQKSTSIKKAVPYLLIFGTFGTWLISFGVLFFINLRHGIQTEGLQQFHERYFLAFPNSIENLEQSWKMLISIFRSIVGKTALAIGWAFLCFVLGIYRLWKTQKGLLILFSIPILSCFFASMLHYYSMVIRLTLFLFPIIICLIGFGANFLIRKINFDKHIINKGAYGLVFVLMIFTLIHRNSLPHITEEYVRENPRLVLEELAKKKDVDIPIYITLGGVPAFEFYTKLYETPIQIPSRSIVYGKWDDNIIELAKQWKTNRIKEIWIFDSHSFGDTKAKIDNEITEVGIIKERIEAFSGEAFLIQLN